MKKRQNRKSRKSFFDLTPEERDREVARYDREIDLEKETRPLTAKERLLFERMRRGKARHVFMWEVDPKLLGEASKLAHSKGIPLGKLVEEGVRGMLAFSTRG